MKSWIAPSGKMYPISDEQCHEEAALANIITLDSNYDGTPGDTPVDILLKAGWLRQTKDVLEFWRVTPDIETNILNLLQDGKLRDNLWLRSRETKLEDRVNLKDILSEGLDVLSYFRE